MTQESTNLTASILTANLPPHIAYDAELFKPIPLGMGGYPYWPYAPQCGISVLVAWMSWELSPRIYLAVGNDGGAAAATRFIYDVHQCEGAALVTWNGAKFDDALVEATATKEWGAYWREGILPRRRRVDLCVVAGVAEKSLSKSEVLYDSAMGQLAAGLHPKYPLLAGFQSENAHVNVVTGWRLESAYASTFGIDTAWCTLKAIHGADAPLAWHRGEVGTVIGYCLGDVVMLRELHLHAWEHGHLKSGDRVARLPRTVL